MKKRVLASLMSLSMAAGLAGFGGAEVKAGSMDITEDITINIRAMNQYTNLDRILDKYYELVADDPNLSHVKLNFSYVTGGDYKDKLTTAIVAQEDVDLMFVGSWQGRTDFIKDGVFKELSSYFEDEENFPGLAKYFTQDMLDAQKYKDGLYYIPLGVGEDLRGVAYREDLRKEYGCDAIVDDATLMEYLKTIQSHIDDGSLDMNAAWGVTQGQGFMTFRNMMFEAPRNNIYKVTAGTDFFVYVDDNNKVVNAVVMGDDDEQFKDFPEGYKYDFITEHMDVLHRCAQVLIEREKIGSAEFEAIFDGRELPEPGAEQTSLMSGMPSEGR